MKIPVNWPISVSEFLLSREEVSAMRDFVKCPSCGCDDFQHKKALGFYACHVCGYRVEEDDMEQAANGMGRDD